MSKLKLINITSNLILEIGLGLYDPDENPEDEDYGETYTYDKPLTGAGETITSKVMSKNYSWESLWSDMCKKVIDKLEGGYFFKPAENFDEHKCMNHYDPTSESSTETMFGIDRLSGQWDEKEKGRAFWEIIDQEKVRLGAKRAYLSEPNPPYTWKNLDKFCKKWYHFFDGGDLKEVLYEKACDMMFDTMETNMKNFDDDEDTKNKILSSKGLIFHFVYACWNGSGFFQNWANQMKSAVKDGKTVDELIDLSFNQRDNRGGSESNVEREKEIIRNYHNEH